MTRVEATNELRQLLDAQGLSNWHVRLNNNFKGPLGLCSYKDRCIILNVHHVDTNPDEEIINTIRHEVAHALCPGMQHNDTWATKARELGCDNTLPCASYNLNEEAVDAIRSGATVEVTFEEQVIRTPKYKITRLQDHCEVCGKVAKIKTTKEVKTSQGRKKVITLECLHVMIKDCDSTSDFEDIVFDGNPLCEHLWGAGKNRTKCVKCDAKRLFEYQIEGARAIERANGSFALLDEQGLGKTIQTLAWMKYHPEAFPYLWVTKSGIKYQHAKEIVRVLGKEHFPQVITAGRHSLIPGMSGYLASYDIFKRMPSLKMFEEAGIKSIILDECQAIKNPDSSRTKSIRQLVGFIPNVIPMSGTFWKNRGSEAFVMLNMLDPKRFWSFERFKRDHVETYWEKGKLKEGGLKPNFIKDISEIAIRRERVQVMPELPIITRNKLICEVPAHARNVYKEEEDKIVNLWNDAVIGGEEDSFEMKAAIMRSLIIMRQIVGIAKVETSVEFAKEFLESTNRKMVVFVNHIECGKLIMSQLTEFCKEEGMQEPLQLSAKLNSEERIMVQDKFNGPNHRIMVASTLASGEGLNLQTCSDCIMHERQWNPANEEQAEGRFIRIGQEAQCVTATYVHAEDTVDTQLDGIVENKRIQFHNSMNEGMMPTWNEQNIFTELMSVIVKNRKKK